MTQLTVIISGGFFLAYQQLLPAFERSSGIAVTTLSGASQGTGPKTIKSQLQSGAEIDVVILSQEGLAELVAMKRIVVGSDIALASVPLAVAVPKGAPKPDIGSVACFRHALLAARLVVMPGSTSGLFVQDEVFARLDCADQVSWRLMPRGTDSTALLAAGGADLAIGPVSELVDQPGIEIVGPLPDDVQLVQIFTAAIVDTSRRVDEAKALIDFLVSDRAAASIRNTGMKPVHDD